MHPKALPGGSTAQRAITSFDYDAAQYITDVLKLTYPGFTKTDVGDAISVSSAYRALARKPLNIKGQPGMDPPATAAASSVSASAATPQGSPPPAPNFSAPFWNFLLAIPLAVLYLALSFMFGGVGSIANYLYATAAPDSVAKTPSAAPWYPVVAGGGAAILVLLVVMAGFQFLTIGAATPDLAYPNPLTVCGLSVLVGLSGDRFPDRAQGMAWSIVPVQPTRAIKRMSLRQAARAPLTKAAAQSIARLVKMATRGRSWSSHPVARFGWEPRARRAPGGPQPEAR